MDDYVRFVTEKATSIAMTTCDIERASGNDPELCLVRQCLVNRQIHRIEFKQHLPIGGKFSSIGLSYLLFVRKLCTKLPEFFDVDNLEVRDRNAEKKENSKMYSVNRRRAVGSDTHSDV